MRVLSILLFLAILCLEVTVNVTCDESVGQGGASFASSQEKPDPVRKGEQEDTSERTAQDNIPNEASDAPDYTLNKVKTGRLYRVIKAHEGGWKTSDVGAPFEAGAQVYCHYDMTLCAAGEGVDFISDQNTELCEVVEVLDIGQLRVNCEEDEKAKLISDDCCEKAVTEDASVYATPRGLIHYATWGNWEPNNIARGINMVEETYEYQLRRRYRGVPLPLLYFADWQWNREQKRYSIDNTIPKRFKISSLYQPQAPFYRTLTRTQTYPISDKWELVTRIKALGMNSKGGPFPVSYFTIPEALTSVHTAQFLIKSIQDEYGTGIYVQSRDVLNGLWEKQATIQGVQVVIEEVVTDLSQIAGHQFDIKFYVLVHAGRVYMHQNAEVVLAPRPIFNGTTTLQQTLLSSIGDTECVHSFLSNKSSEEGKRWLESIQAQLVAALPAIEPVTRATEGEGDRKLYHIFAGKAVVRDNGDALILSFTDWPIVDWNDTGYDDSTCNGTTSELTVDERRVAYEETLSTIFFDFYSIVLGLANTTVTDDFLLDGRVREAIGFRSPSKAKAQSH